MRKLLFLSLILVTSCFSFSCTNNIDEPTTEEQDKIVAGDAQESRFSIDGVVVEQCQTEFMKFGSDEYPTLFAVSKEHLLKGAPIADRTHYTNIFRSITKEDVTKMMELYAKANRLPIITDEEKSIAYSKMQLYSKSNCLDLGVLVAIYKIANPEGSINPFGVANDLAGNSIASKIINDGVTLSNELLKYEQSLYKSNTEVKPETKVISLIAIAAAAMEMTQEGLSIICDMIVEAEPVVDVTSSFASYINANEPNTSNYPTSGHEHKSPKYTLEYYNDKENLKAAVTYVIASDFYGINPDLGDGIKYIPSIGILISGIECANHHTVKGTTNFGSGPIIIGHNNELLVPCNIYTNYGLKDSPTRAYLQFIVSGEVGTIDHYGGY